MRRAAFAAAEKLFHECLQMYSRLDGCQADEDRVAFALRDLGRSQLESGKLDKAKMSLQESLDMFRRLRKESDHEDIAGGLYWQARFLCEKREFDEAGGLYKECLWMCKSLIKVLYPLTGRVLRGLAKIALEQNMLEEAERLCLESSALNWEEDFGTLGLLARIALKRESFEEGLKLCGKNLEMAKRIYGQDVNRPGVIGILVTVAEIKFGQGCAQEAMEGIEQALVMYRSMFEDNFHPRIIEAESLLKKWKIELECCIEIVSNSGDVAS